jgi:hypothetical protein
MKSHRRLSIFLWAVCFLTVFFYTTTGSVALDAGTGGRQVPDGVTVELTKEFYEALLNKNASGKTVYTNDPSQEYLQQIAVSTRFLVETNLEILKQQERLNRLLESFLEKKK